MLIAVARRAALIVRHPRLRKRALIVIANSANSLLVPLLSPAFSILVIRLASVALWGDFIRVLVVTQLAAHVAGWGNKDYLLREFSRSPAQIAAAWQNNLVTRLGLFGLLAIILAAFGYTPLRLVLVVGLSFSLMLDQSYDVYILYRRDFLYAFGVEMVGLFILIAPVLWLRESLTVDWLIGLFGLSNAAKVGLWALRYQVQSAGHRRGRFDPEMLRLAFPFFLLGLTGLVQSRVDLYAVSYFLPAHEVGQYQVYSNLVIYVQSVSAFVLLPFVKTLYRLSYEVILRLSALLFGFGLLVLALGMPAAGLVLRWLYHLDFPPIFLLAGGLMALPVYFYVPVIYALYKANRPSVVVAVNLFGFGLSLVLSLWWLPVAGMLGAAFATAATQWAMGGVYLVVSRSLRVGDVVPVAQSS